jgi:hypothetical protein
MVKGLERRLPGERFVMGQMISPVGIWAFERIQDQLCNRTIVFSDESGAAFAPLRRSGLFKVPFTAQIVENPIVKESGYCAISLTDQCATSFLEVAPRFVGHRITEADASVISRFSAHEIRGYRAKVAVPRGFIRSCHVSREPIPIQ